MDSVVIKKIILEDSLYYSKVLLVHYKIEYPQFFSETYQKNLVNINRYYKNKALEIQKYAVTTMFNAAIEQYQYSLGHDYVPRPFELTNIYQVTYNMNCTISLYFDRYEYLGGAHGITVKDSDTWDIQRGKRQSLGDFFEEDDYLNYVKTFILQEIDFQKDNQNYNYFFDYEKHIYDYERIDNFYLIPNGIIIYFQIYDITPYAAGMPEFFIPFDSENVETPSCEYMLA